MALLFGGVLLTDRVDLVDADACSVGFGDCQVETCKQVRYSLPLMAEQHRYI